MGPIRRRLIKTAIILAGLAPVLALAGVYFLHDIDPPEGPDLRVPVVAVPDALNGFLLLSKGLEKIDWPEDRLPEGSDKDAETISVQDLAEAKIWDARFAADVLSRHQDLLERFDRSLAMPGFQAPPTTAPGYSAAHIQVWRKLFCFASIRIWDRLAVGDDIGALREAVRALRFARRCEEAGGSMFNYFIGLAFEGSTLASLGRLVTNARFEAARLKDLLGELEKLEPGHELFHDVLRSGSADMVQEIELWAQSGFSFTDPSLVFGYESSMPVWPWRSSFLYLPNDTKRVIAELCRETLSAVPADGPWRPVDLSPFEGFASNRWFPGRNGMGRYAVADVAHVYRGALELHQTSKLQFLFLRTIFALRGFRTAQGRLPDRLDELVPDWIAEVPKDPFDGSPLRYDPKRRVIWSVGSDGIDQGGLFDPDLEDPELDLADPAAKIEFE